MTDRAAVLLVGHGEFQPRPTVQTFEKLGKRVCARPTAYMHADARLICHVFVTVQGNRVAQPDTGSDAAKFKVAARTGLIVSVSCTSHAL